MLFCNNKSLIMKFYLAKKYLFLIITSSFLFFSDGCSTNPATGERHVNLISEDQEIQMGKEADQQIVNAMGIYQNEELINYVKNIGQQLAAISERPNLPWTFRVIDDPVVNAFALPGGFIYVTRGILSHLNTEAELAGILGHEIGHVTGKHSVYRLSSQQLAQIGVGIAVIVEPELQQYLGLANLGLSLMFLKFSRDDEREADELGIRYMNKKNYNPNQLVDVMQTLERVSQQSNGSGVPQWLSTHPTPSNRIELIHEDIDTLSGNIGSIIDREEYLNHLDDMIFGQDPREGYFKGSTFYHPQLQFTYNFPSGWKTINQKQAVIGVSSNQDAVVQITLSGKKSVQEAANEFFSQEGISGSNVQTTNINGLTAATGNFSVETEQGALNGKAFFISFDRNIYQIIGYSSEQTWSSYQNEINNSFKTFQQLKDQQAMNVEPKRIQIVTLNETMTLQQFAQKYPSTVSLETLAIINQVETNASFNLGQKIKRVVGQGVP